MRKLTQNVTKTSKRSARRHSPHRLARWFLTARFRDSKRRLTLRYWRGDWWRWVGGCYRHLEDDDLRAYVSRFLDQNLETGVGEEDDEPTVVTTTLVTNVIEALSSITLAEADREQPMWLGKGEVASPLLAVENGLLDVELAMWGRRKALADATPEWFTLAVLPYEYDPKARAPRFLAFLEDVLERDRQRIDLIQEWFGCCLVFDTSFQKFLVLEGEGANGKSVLLEVLTALLGEDNVSNVPVEIFGERFQLGATIGRLANIAPEVTGQSRVAEGLLKQFVGGEPMLFDRKNRSPLTVRPTARLVIAANNRLGFRDESEGLWRRMIIVPFNKSIPPEKQNRHLAKELREELPGILNWALLGLKRLRRQGRFTEPKVSVTAAREYRLDSNPAKAFLEEEYEAAAASSIPVQELYAEYRAWSEARGHRVEDARAFGREVHRVFPAVGSRRPGTKAARIRVYEGLQKRVSTASRVQKHSQLGPRVSKGRARKRKK